MYSFEYVAGLHEQVAGPHEQAAPRPWLCATALGWYAHELRKVTPQDFIISCKLAVAESGTSAISRSDWEGLEVGDGPAQMFTELETLTNFAELSSSPRTQIN